MRHGAHAYFFAFFHRAFAAFFARFVFAAAVIDFPAFVPPTAPRQAGQYLITRSFTGLPSPCFLLQYSSMIEHLTAG